MKFGDVVKVIVPEMVPLSQDHNVRWLASSRLQQKAWSNKYAIEDFNIYPHPFA